MQSKVSGCTSAVAVTSVAVTATIQQVAWQCSRQHLSGLQKTTGSFCMLLVSCSYLFGKPRCQDGHRQLLSTHSEHHSQGLRQCMHHLYGLKLGDTRFLHVGSELFVIAMHAMVSRCTLPVAVSSVAAKPTSATGLTVLHASSQRP